MKIQEVLNKKINEISLSEEETKEVISAANYVVSALKAAGFKAEVGGSLAKGTLVRKKVQDVDVFVVFENEEDISKLDGFLEKLKLEARKIHGSRDYYHVIKNNLIIEIIPVVSFSEPCEAKNVTDFSLLHVKYVRKKITKKIADEIKLAKTFCYAQNCYGAESYIGGFSGYALELLVIHYKSFLGFIRQVSNKNGKIIIDPEKKFKKNILQELNESKLQSPIILIDPTCKQRNVTAGLSEETFEKFRDAAKQFLKRPSLSFFEPRQIDAAQLKKEAEKRKLKFIEIEFKTERQEGDIAATKMKKFFDFIASELERKGQQAIKKEFEYLDGKKARGFLILKEKKELEVRGPPVGMKEAVSAFKKANKKTYLKKGFIMAKKKALIEDILSSLKRFQEEMGVEFNLSRQAQKDRP